jgi:hypothetical protein
MGASGNAGGLRPARTRGRSVDVPETFLLRDSREPYEATVADAYDVLAEEASLVHTANLNPHPRKPQQATDRPTSGRRRCEPHRRATAEMAPGTSPLLS